MKRLGIAVVLLSLFSASFAFARSLPVVKGGALSQTPIIDGIVRENEWQGSATIDEFVQVMTGEPAARKTTGRIGYDSNALYVTLECSSTDAPYSQADTRRDGDIAATDHVEVYLDPSGRCECYYRFVVNRAGGVYDAYVMDKTYDAVWSAAVSERPGSWTVELRIPFTSIGICSTNPPSAVWAANFCRGYISPSGAEDEFSAWSPALLPKPIFNVPRRFGLLENVKVDAGLFPVDPRMTVTYPQRWYSGPNYTTVRVSMKGTAPIKARLACIETPTGRQVATTPVIPIRPGPAQPVTIWMDGAETSPANRMFVLYDASDAQRVLASSPVVDCATAPGLEVRLLSPSFRNVVQSRDPSKLLWIRCFIGEVNRTVLRCRVRLVGREDGKDYWRRDPRVSPRSVFDFRRALDLPVGDYRLLVELVDKSGAALASEELSIRVLPESPFEVTFATNRACFVNGKPFFPIGLAMGDGLDADPSQTCAAIKNQGFNLIQADGWPLRADGISATTAAGLYLLSGTSEGSMEQIGTAFSDLPGLLAWQQGTDPDPGSADACAELRARLAAGGPQRPVTAVFSTPEHFGDFADCLDLVVTSPFGIRYAPMTSVSTWIKSALAGVGERQPVWARLQAFGLEDTIYSLPTTEELRCQAYLSLVSGATGIIWDAYRLKPSPDFGDATGWTLAQTPLWNYLGKLNAELSQIAPIVLAGKDYGPVQASDATVAARMWRYRGKWYVIAVNTSPRSVTCLLTLLERFEARVMFEDRKVDIVTTRLKDSFNPYEAHVYVF